MRKKYFVFILMSIIFCSCKTEEPQVNTINAYIQNVSINGISVSSGGTVYNIPVDSIVFTIDFSEAIDKSKINPQHLYLNNGIDTSFMILNDTSSNKLIFRIKNRLEHLTRYTLYIAEGENLGVNLIDSYQFSFITQLDSTPKFSEISDDSLLTLVQKQTFRYFWDYGHPVSGLARERTGSGETVTIGGSGFGVMATLVGIERGFITRQQGFERLSTIVNFLNTKADRFHGVFSHWLNGTTGKVQPFSEKDNGADLVETAFLMEGLLTVQQYFKNGNREEKNMCDTIQKIWENVEWNWFQQNGQQKLYWHWSPNYGWAMNMPITGWNEALIIYILAAASPTHSIEKTVYDNGWARNGAIRNGKTFYDILLPLGEDRGGPLFFTHYSFLGLDPRILSDAYANYWTQNTAHAQINYRYCVANPKKNFGYSRDCWGLTASDAPNGYTASSPNNDNGTIAPTAALSSFPYTPEESMQALHFFYYILGDKIWGEYGFMDAFNLNKQWFSNSYLAIDEGPIIGMIENYRTGLLWNLFMQNEDVQRGLEKLEFDVNRIF
ncbi:MAG TPA: glucoamylase family protein [Paludibacteraceae bacterium]|nr:Ig-like domain-containing protein [Paludibacteraceae bacterium]HON03219.1 glucoamylase family protein [Paludibacteraceae bacterium]HPD59552.1 glucoamylase family protein [Paludibacteraceae bacterium]HRS24829.1 glucoamylase family protein [Paludibacteraceae bacterium]HRT79234.1 glucoamylase family protein [Paludibacteraceae bacterium]